MIELRHMDARHFVIIECSNLANCCTTKCGCIGLMLFRYVSCLGAIKAIQIVYDMFRYNYKHAGVCDALVAICATTH